MAKKISKFLYWTPRIISILFICFIALFSFDVISPSLSLGQIITGMLLHNVPTFILIAVLIIAWKYEIVGGIAFITAGLLYIILTARAGIAWYIKLSWSLTISGPTFFIGILFLMNWYKKRCN